LTRKVRSGSDLALCVCGGGILDLGVSWGRERTLMTELVAQHQVCL
jgi:hypothetical protein